MTYNDPVRVIVGLIFLCACGDSHKAKPDAPADVAYDVACGGCDAPNDANPLDDLLGTGLCMDKACTMVKPENQLYTPQFALWADAASKRRWLYLPPGSQIDTSDMDHWKFPMGTKVWKEFTTDASDGSKRVETRFIEKTGAGDAITDWYMIAYQWDAADDDATAVPSGATDANGTAHDIPSQGQCRACHENLQPTRLLGVGAIQLDVTPASGEIGIDDLIAANKLSAPPSGSVPHFAVPTDAGNAYAHDALGYLHANCGHCHNPTSSVYVNNGILMQLRMTVATLGSVTTTPAYTTAVDQDRSSATCCFSDTKIIVSGMPDHSIMIDRFEALTNGAGMFNRMPALGSKVMDPTGDTLLRNWIMTL